MKSIWVLPICLLIIGFFGMFWILAISDAITKANFTININMDNNTLEAIKEMRIIQDKQINNTNLTESLITYNPMEK